MLGSAVLSSLTELRARADNPIFVVSSGQLFNVPGVIKNDANKPEPAVTTRLDNIEQMMEAMSKSLKELKQNQSPAL